MFNKCAFYVADMTVKSFSRVNPSMNRMMCQHFCKYSQQNAIQGLLMRCQHSSCLENPGRKINVCVEGNIGSGKTTFLKHFRDFESQVKLVAEPVKEWRNFGGQNPLACLYQEPERWAFTFQSLVQLTLLKYHTAMQTKPLRIMERSLLSAKYCFAENLKQSGHLTDLEYAVLTQWFDYAIKQYKVKIDLVVYLQTSPEVCLRRIQSRNRPEERIVSLEYLNQLHSLHENWLLQSDDTSIMRPPVMVINGDHDLQTMKSKFTRLKTDLLSRIESVPS